MTQNTEELKKREPCSFYCTNCDRIIAWVSGSGIIVCGNCGRNHVLVRDQGGFCIAPALEKVK